MAGLGRRILGAALAGAGAGIVQQAKQRREDTLLKLRREFLTSERTAGETFRSGEAQTGRDASSALTGEGWDRADARAQTGREHSTSEREAGQEFRAGETAAARTTQEGIAGATMAARRQAAGDKPLVASESPMTGERTYTTAREALSRGQESAAQGESAAIEVEAEKAVESNTGYTSSDTDDLGGPRDMYKANYIAVRREMPTASPSEVHAKAKQRTAGGGRSNGGGGGVMRSAAASDAPAEYPDARQAPDGNWYVQRNGKTFRVD